MPVLFDLPPWPVLALMGLYFFIVYAIFRGAQLAFGLEQTKGLEVFVFFLGIDFTLMSAGFELSAVLPKTSALVETLTSPEMRHWTFRCLAAATILAAALSIYLEHMNVLSLTKRADSWVPGGMHAFLPTSFAVAALLVRGGVTILHSGLILSFHRPGAM